MTKKTIQSVERELTHRGVVYVLCPCLDVNKAAREKEILGYKTIMATLPIHRNLRGKTDLHGKPYQPSKWLYVSQTK